MSKGRFIWTMVFLSAVWSVGGYTVYMGYRRGDMRLMAMSAVLVFAVTSVAVLLNVVANQRFSGEREMMRAMAGPCERELSGRLQFGHHRARSARVYLCRDGILVHDSEWRRFSRDDVSCIDVVGARGVQAELKDGRRFRISVDGGMDAGLRADVLRYGSTYAV